MRKQTSAPECGRRILRLSNPQTDDVLDVYLPIPVQVVGRIAEALGDDWVMTPLPSDAPRPAATPEGGDTRG